MTKTVVYWWRKLSWSVAVKGSYPLGRVAWNPTQRQLPANLTITTIFLATAVTTDTVVNIHLQPPVSRFSYNRTPMLKVINLIWQASLTMRNCRWWGYLLLPSSRLMGAVDSQFLTSTSPSWTPPLTCVQTPTSSAEMVATACLCTYAVTGSTTVLPVRTKKTVKDTTVQVFTAVGDPPCACTPMTCVTGRTTALSKTTNSSVASSALPTARVTVWLPHARSLSRPRPFLSCGTWTLEAAGWLRLTCTSTLCWCTSAWPGVVWSMCGTSPFLTWEAWTSATTSSLTLVWISWGPCQACRCWFCRATRWRLCLARTRSPPAPSSPC